MLADDTRLLSVAFLRGNLAVLWPSQSHRVGHSIQASVTIPMGL